MRRTREGKPPGQLQECLASAPAPAHDETLSVGVVVIGELLAFANRARRSNPDDAVDDVDVAVRAAGMVDVSRDVAADARVDDRAVRQLEAPDVALFDVPRLALEALLVGDLLAGVMNDPLVFLDGFRRIHAPAVNLRTPTLDHLLKYRMALNQEVCSCVSFCSSLS